MTRIKSIAFTTLTVLVIATSSLSATSAAQAKGPGIGFGIVTGIIGGVVLGTAIAHANDRHVERRDRVYVERNEYRASERQTVYENDVTVCKRIVIEDDYGNQIVKKRCR